MKSLDQQLQDAAERLVDDLLGAQLPRGGYHPHQLIDLEARALRTIAAAYRLGCLTTER